MTVTVNLVTAAGQGTANKAPAGQSVLRGCYSGQTSDESLGALHLSINGEWLQLLALQVLGPPLNPALHHSRPMLRDHWLELEEIRPN